MRLFRSHQRCLGQFRAPISLSSTRPSFPLAGIHSWQDPGATPRFRRLSSSVAISSPPTHQIYISKSTNPYFNLTLEDWLFRHAPPDTPLLLIYRDEPCIVIGRHQNPWKEINFPALRARSPSPGSTANTLPEKFTVPFIRRRSGGGTVYHDLGNTNFSIHLPRASFDRHITARLIVRAVRSLGVDAYVNERNDIFVGSYKHVSGSAYKIVSGRAYHHGTMLISTDLAALGDVLKPKPKGSMVTKGVASVPSPVSNLQQFNPSITHESFADAVINEFCAEYRLSAVVPRCVLTGDEEELKSVEHLEKGMIELPSWDWSFGQTPEFTYTFNHSFLWGDVTGRIHSKHGIILSCTLQVGNSSLSAEELRQVMALSKSLESKRYDPADVIGQIGPDEISRELGAWISQVIAG